MGRELANRWEVNTAVKIFLLGRFEVEKEGDRIPAAAWRRRRPADLLKLLALAPERAMHREEIIDRLWPDKDVESGANNLHRGLHDLRQILGSDCAHLDKGILRLNPEIWIDIEAFERAVKNGDPASLAQALSLYQGDLCPDSPYHEAFEPRREAIRQRFVEAAVKLSRHYLSTQQDSLALEALRQLLSVDSTQEEAHRLMMKTLAQAGRRHDALRQYESCVKALSEKLDASPSEQTVALFQAISNGEFAPARAKVNLQGWKRIARRLLGTAEPAAMRGREAAIEQLQRFIAGGEGLLLIMGEAGVGKTRLAVEGAKLADAQGAFVLAGAGFSVEETTPYAPFSEACADYVRASGLPFDDNPFVSVLALAGSASSDQKLRLFQAVEQALKQWSNNRPIFLILEDIHQVDESSLHLFHYLARTTRTEPLMLVATCRKEESGADTPIKSLLANLHRERLGQRLVLERLDKSATQQLATDILNDHLDNSLISSIYRLTDGNPFYTEEVVRALKETGQIAIPEDLAETVRERVNRLGNEAERLLVVGAAYGLRFDFEMVCNLSGLVATDALAGLEKALHARLIEEEESGYRFRHALVREALYGAISRPRRIQLHRAIAEGLEQRKAPEELAEKLAYHYRAAEQYEQALPYLKLAGKRAAQRVGYQEAVIFFEQALEILALLKKPACPDHFWLLLKLGQMRFALSDLDRAIADLDRAASLRSEAGWQPSPTERARAARLAALAFITGGNLPAANDRLEMALSFLRESNNDPELSHVLYHLAQLRWHEGQHREAYRIAEQCLIQAEQHGEAQLIARGYEMLALACHSLGEWREGIEFETKRQHLVGGALDVAQTFDVHL